MAGWCGYTDVLGVRWLFECALAAVIVVCVVQFPGGAVLSGDGCSKRDIHSRWRIWTSESREIPVVLLVMLLSMSMRRSFQVLLACSFCRYC
jgi:hypothetical protein